MTIQFANGLTPLEQVARWEIGNDEEAALARWLIALRAHDYERGRSDGYDDGYSDGDSDGYYRGLQVGDDE